MSNSPQGSVETGASAWANVSYFPNDNLAKAIVRAWSDKSFEEQLLTFGRGTSADWSIYLPDIQTSMLLKTSGALAQVDVYLERAVVLTVDQYAWYSDRYKTYQEQPGQFIFVLPEPVGRAPSLATAEVAMAVHPCGI